MGYRYGMGGGGTMDLRTSLLFAAAFATVCIVMYIIDQYLGGEVR